MKKVTAILILIFVFLNSTIAQKNISVGLYFLPQINKSTDFGSTTGYNFGDSQGLGIHFGGRVESMFSKRIGYNLGFDFGSFSVHDDCYIENTFYPTFENCNINYSETYFLLNLNPSLSFYFFENKKNRFYFSFESSILIRLSGFTLVDDKSEIRKTRRAIKARLLDFFYPKILLGWKYSIGKNADFLLESSYGSFNNYRSKVESYGLKVGIILKDIL